MFRRWSQTSVMLQIGHNLQLDILVENTGRVNAGPRMVDPKGIVGNMTIGGTLLMNWQMYQINLGNVVSKLQVLNFLPFLKMGTTTFQLHQMTHLPLPFLMAIFR